MTSTNVHGEKGESSPICPPRAKKPPDKSIRAPNGTRLSSSLVSKDQTLQILCDPTALVRDQISRIRASQAIDLDASRFNPQRSDLTVLDITRGKAPQVITLGNDPQASDLGKNHVPSSIKYHASNDASFSVPIASVNDKIEKN
ncbi:hypothetical protein Cni_G05622 [Canna indica]|uniref:Uncharacterized protein n=1 Tax=Canna indica TaxID=4628 RepID=A0AAQ3JXA3_9LILI|nr:hypothetical protein Cni_G05622 [Canna indica]